MEVRDCKDCRHNVPIMKINAVCESCRMKSNWEPINRGCSTCKYCSLNLNEEPCNSCINDAYWEPKGEEDMTTIITPKYDKAILKDVETRYDVTNGKVYLNVTYEYENSNGKYELNIPKIELPLNCTGLPVITKDTTLNITGHTDTFVNFGIAKLAKLAIKPVGGMNFTIKEIEKKTKKMTVAEIEQALGYKIEVVVEK